MTDREQIGSIRRMVRAHEGAVRRLNDLEQALFQRNRITQSELAGLRRVHRDCEQELDELAELFAQPEG